MQITFDRKTVNECLQQRFVLPTYQRDYKWEYKHLQDLINDIKEAFLSSRKPTHGRNDVLGYEPYFLGTIITTLVDQGGKAIVDGQQRITTLALLLCYAHRISKQRPELAISPVDQTIRRRIAGGNQFNLDMDEPRKALFEALIDGPADIDELTASIDSIPGKDAGTNQLWALFQQIDSLLCGEVVDENLLAQFFDYLTECVYLFEIGVPREQDGHKVFVTMNDRGLKLSPIDLLKGFLLSSISNNEANRASHASWTRSIKKLKDLGSDEDSAFFKTWIRAQYATTIRGKRRGDEAGDFEIIGDSYHRWVIDNKESLNLKTSDDFVNLLTDVLPYYVDVYCSLKEKESKFSASEPHVFYNGARDLTLQTMVIMSAVRSNDTNQTTLKKIRAVSYYLDYLATVRVLNGKDNTYDNVRDLMFEIAKKVRNLDLPALKTTLENLISAEQDKLDQLQNASYLALKRQDLLHLLARIAAELEDSLEIATKVGFPDYVDRTRDSKTFDIEHLLANSFTAVNDDLSKAGRQPFTASSDFELKRNAIGGLILLPRGRNRSMKDMMYSEKLARYAGENILAQTLTDSFFLNQPNWNVFSSEAGITCQPIAAADADAIIRRTEFYLSIAKRTWSNERFHKTFE